MAAQSVCVVASVAMMTIAHAAAATENDDESTSYDSESMQQDARMLLSVAAGIFFMKILEMVRSSEEESSVDVALNGSFKIYPFVL